MSTTYRVALSTTALFLLAFGAHAQQAAQGGAGAGVVAATAQNRSQSITIGMPALPVRPSVITGVPYSAEEVFDRTQTLADGTRITQRTRVTKFFRDSEGRTRNERPMFMGAREASEDVMIVEISDPVSGFRYVLDPYNHIAHRFSPPEKPNEPTRYSQQANAASSRTTSSTSVRTVVSAAPARPEVTTESLGTQTIEGVSVEGTRMTTTVAVGEIGNDRPIVSVRESWFSPDLKVVVLSKTSDPRMGESTMKLRNIDRTEPDPALFRAPADYQLVDESGDRIEIKVTRP